MPSLHRTLVPLALGLNVLQAAPLQRGPSGSVTPAAAEDTAAWTEAEQWLEDQISQDLATFPAMRNVLRLGSAESELGLQEVNSTSDAPELGPYFQAGKDLLMKSHVEADGNPCTAKTTIKLPSNCAKMAYFYAKYVMGPNASSLPEDQKIDATVPWGGSIGKEDKRNWPAGCFVGDVGDGSMRLYYSGHPKVGKTNESARPICSNEDQGAKDIFSACSDRADLCAGYPRLHYWCPDTCPPPVFTTDPENPNVPRNATRQILGYACPIADVVDVDPTGCIPTTPHFDPEGMVCSNDGTAEEAYCSYDVGETACVYCRSAPAETNPARKVQKTRRAQ